MELGFPTAESAQVPQRIKDEIAGMLRAAWGTKYETFALGYLDPEFAVRFWKHVQKIETREAQRRSENYPSGISFNASNWTGSP